MHPKSEWFLLYWLLQPCFSQYIVAGSSGQYVNAATAQVEPVVKPDYYRVPLPSAGAASQSQSLASTIDTTTILSQVSGVPVMSTTPLASSAVPSSLVSSVTSPLTPPSIPSARASIPLASSVTSTLSQTSSSPLASRSLPNPAAAALAAASAVSAASAAAANAANAATAPKKVQLPYGGGGMAVMPDLSSGTVETVPSVWQTEETTVTSVPQQVAALKTTQTTYQAAPVVQEDAVSTAIESAILDGNQRAGGGRVVGVVEVPIIAND